MFTPSPDDFGRNGEWSIKKDFDTFGLKRSLSVMHDEVARKENALGAEWDKKSDIKEKKIEGRRITKGTRWDKKDTDTKACKALHWEPRMISIYRTKMIINYKKIHYHRILTIQKSFVQ